MLSNDGLSYPYTSQRMATYAKNGMVATSQPLAAQIGADILKNGGNAIDAAIATAAALTVVEPTGCGIGGDAFAIVWVKDKLYGLNGSSFAPEALTPELMTEQGHDKMPLYGWTPVTVPGIPASWAALSERFGKLPFADLMEPAAKLADDGFPVSPTISFLWEKAENTFSSALNDELKQAWLEMFTIEGKTPAPGELFRSPGHASTLREIGATKASSFYHGELADKIDAFSQQTGGLIRKSDLERYEVEWVTPISINYKGYDVWEIPPNGQGMVALMALNMLKNDTFSSRDDLDTIHKQCEAMKLAYVDGQAYITQSDKMSVSVEGLLSDEYAQTRRNLIGSKAIEPSVGKPPAGGTVYLAVADNEGNMVSFIQSNYHGFGSGVVVPGTGIALQNRGENFSLDPNHDNYLQPNKKTYHTIIPGFITKGKEPVGPFGVMGGFMQPQGHMQVVMNMVDFGLNPQSALDAPRWQWMGGMNIGLEQAMPNHIVTGMLRKGHHVQVASDYTTYGRGQIIVKDPKSGVLCGGTEARTDGSIAAF
ncbi:gamma-glutamyltransferase family protein [Vibrio sp. SS-MA-C1-2]|uniref:gamma-glutamyltransferase family protein n=1 Tax=Vibrio sp. SS-MA-C1-2 TaxID=2908646 RepID=UPI001F3146DD|nr:gamma-glutamyltransferase family protein [Vibrio sp. SS-MA-C1-2]UJF17903.1 gamma-glutamyltransferase family protein [Vibrio sp. SS-MA-C1-2]